MKIIKAYSDSIIYNPSFNEYEIYHTNEYYKRITNMMIRWNLSIEDCAYLIINFELGQTLSTPEKNIKKNIIIIENVNFIKKIMIKEKTINKSLNNRQLHRSQSHS